MKKNIAMRVAACLFILAMITTCAFATTFAKYITSDTATDSARVAKWGVTVSMTGMDQTEYEYAGTAQDESISATTSEKNIAPGSHIRFATIDLKGTPEVAVSVTFEATLTLTNWKVGSAEYCPLVFKVGNTTIQMGGAIDTVAKLEDAVEAAIVAYSKEYAVNTNLAAESVNTLTVHCSWAYAGSDVNDTALGDAAADGITTNDPKIDFTIKCTVTQLD